MRCSTQRGERGLWFQESCCGLPQVAVAMDLKHLATGALHVREAFVAGEATRTGWPNAAGSVTRGQ
jgi:hypothetical protein